MKLRKGDQVMVMVGKDKGRKGKIEKVFPKLNKVLIPGINVFKKHVKPQGEGKPGGIVDVVKPLRVNNVALWCSKCGQPTRIGYKVDQKEKHRLCRKCQTII